MDIRENLDDLEEAIRAGYDGLRKHMWTAVHVMVPENSPDGHTVNLQVASKASVTDQNGNTTHVDYPMLQDATIVFSQGGNLVHTMPVTKGDEGVAIFSARPLDSWFNTGQSQPPVDTRAQSFSDPIFLPGHRSNPRKIPQVDGTAAQMRSVDKHHVSQIHPTNGFMHKSVDPSTQPASATFDPFSAAVTFFESIIHPTNGHAHNATSNGTTHSITNTHSAGPAMAAANGTHSVGANPLTGPLISAANGAHTIAANPASGIAIASKIAHTIAAPNASLSASGALSVAQSVSALSGAFGGFSFGMGGGTGEGSIAVTENLQADQLLISGSFTVSQLNTMFPPASTAIGARAAVTDATAPTFLAVLTGGGSVVCPAFNNGVAWVSA
jgi:hypothetical protein